MAEVIKVTHGFVTQVWDKDTGKFLRQDFTAGDDVCCWNSAGEVIDEDEIPGYEPFDMVQPDGPFVILELVEGYLNGVQMRPTREDAINCAVQIAAEQSGRTENSIRAELEKDSSFYAKDGDIKVYVAQAKEK